MPLTIGSVLWTGRVFVMPGADGCGGGMECAPHGSMNDTWDPASQRWGRFDNPPLGGHNDLWTGAALVAYSQNFGAVWDPTTAAWTRLPSPTPWGMWDSPVVLWAGDRVLTLTPAGGSELGPPGGPQPIASPSPIASSDLHPTPGTPIVNGDFSVLVGSTDPVPAGWAVTIGRRMGAQPPEGVTCPSGTTGHAGKQVCIIVNDYDASQNPPTQPVRLSQTVTIPPGTGPVTLTYWIAVERTSPFPNFHQTLTAGSSDVRIIGNDEEPFRDSPAGSLTFWPESADLTWLRGTTTTLTWSTFILAGVGGSTSFYLSDIQLAA